MTTKNDDSHFAVIDKSLSNRVKELTNSVQVLNDSIISINNGFRHQYLPLYAQLRLLLCDENKSRGNYPLLFDLARDFDVQLEAYEQVQVAQDLNKERDKFYFKTTKFSATKDWSNCTKIKLDQLLNLKVVFFNDISFNYKELIEIFANKYGGAHFPRSVEKLKDNINRIFHSNPMIEDSFFYPITMLVIQLSIQIIKNVFDFSFFKYLYIPPQNIQGNKLLFEYKHEFSPQRIRFFLKESFKIEIQVVDINNKIIRFNTKNPISTEEPILISFMSEMTSRFTTKFILVIDESLECETETKFLHELRNDLSNHRMTFNIDSEGNRSNLRLALMTVMIGYKKAYSYSNYSEIYNYMRQERFVNKSKFNCFDKINTANRNAKQNLHFSHNIPELSVDEMKKFYLSLE